VVNVGNAKHSLAIEDGLRIGNLREVGVPGFEPPPEKLQYRLAGKRIASLTTDALDGPDIWMEPKLSRGNLFISDRLAKLLRAAKMTGGWGLKECPIVGVHLVGRVSGIGLAREAGFEDCGQFLGIFIRESIRLIAVDIQHCDDVARGVPDRQHKLGPGG